MSRLEWNILLMNYNILSLEFSSVSTKLFSKQRQVLQELINWQWGVFNIYATFITPSASIAVVHLYILTSRQSIWHRMNIPETKKEPFRCVRTNRIMSPTKVKPVFLTEAGNVTWRSYKTEEMLKTSNKVKVCDCDRSTHILSNFQRGYHFDGLLFGFNCALATRVGQHKTQLFTVF